MNYYLVAPVKTFHSTDNTLTYASDLKLTSGHIVEIPIGKQTTIGLVVKKTTQPNFETKNILRPLYNQALPKHLMQAILWLSDYYQCPLSSVIQAALPSGITKNRRPAKAEKPKQSTVSKDNPLNSAQKRAIKEINANPANTVLLHGITGSGKTNIYIELARQSLAKGQSVILLVPEIALTSQLVANFQSHFNDLTLLHSAQTESVRHQLWEKILKNPNPQLIIGPRSALFAPVAQLGLIIIDEAHEPAYHQDQNPKYSALRLAATMSKTVLGTATPLISDYYICEQRNAVVSLNQLAIKTDKNATTHLIDLKDHAQFTRSRIFSNQLIASIQNSLDQHQQSMLFHNRRGTAPMTICDHCGWQALCANCYLPLVLHADSFQMRCHTCGRSYPVPTSCPDCKNDSIHHKGFGTKYIEEEAKKLFPKARIVRFDADTSTDQQLHKKYAEVRDGDYDIIIGTQMIAKGFDFPKLSTLGIVQADAGLSLPDFSSEERTFQLITQVVGRANRGHQNSNIFIQSFQPDHPIISYAAASDDASLYNYLIQKRKQSKLPPYCFLLKLSLLYKTEKTVVQNIKKLNKKIIQIVDSAQLDQVFVSPPMPSFHERTNAGYSWQIVVKAKSRNNLITILNQLPKSPQLRFDSDPISLL